MTESQRIAAAAGFDFPATVLGLAYAPADPPEFARLGKFAHYMRACCDQALAKEPHASSSYRRYGDPVASLVSGICEAELDGDRLLVGLKGISLGTLVADILDASMCDTDAMRRLQFGCELHGYIGAAYLDIGAQLREAGQLEAALKAANRAGDQLRLATTFTDAMRILNEVPLAAE